MSSDTKILERWTVQRDPEAFRLLVTRYSGMVYATCRRMLQNDAEAEDATQECFEALAEATRGRIRGSAGAWLYGVATRRCLYKLRSDRNRRARENLFVSQQAPEPSTRVAWNEVYRHIDEALAELPEHLREVVVAHYLCNERHAAIAARLKIPRRTVSYRINRGVAELRNILSSRSLTLTAPVLSSLLAANLAEAAEVPATLSATLGKLTLAQAGSGAAAKSLTTAALAAGGTLTMKKSAVILVLLAAVGLGGYVYFDKRNGEPPGHLGAAEPAAVALPPAMELPVTEEKAAEKRKVNATEHKVSGEVNRERQEPAALHAEFGAGLSIAGRVVDHNGDAVPGATVAARPADTPWEKPKLEVTTGQQGVFLFEKVQPGRYNVGAYSPAAGYGWLESVEAGAEDLLISLQQTARISGTVIDDVSGQPVAPAKVLTFRAGKTGPKESDRLLLALQSLEANDHGRFDVDVEAPGSFLLLAKAPGYLEVDLARQQKIVLQPGEHRRNVRLVLTPGLSIGGTVYDPAGSPLPGAQIQLINQSRGGNAPADSAKTGQDGAYLLNYAVEPGVLYTVRAAHPVFGAAESDSITLAPGEHRDGVDLQLAKGHSVRGQVVTSDGRGVSGVTVSLRGKSDKSYVPVQFAEVGADNEGRFEIANIPAGVYKPTVQLYGAQNETMQSLFYGEDFTMPADTDLDGLIIDVGPAVEGYISGKIMDNTSQPLGNIIVMAHSGTASASDRTAQNGTYRFEALGGAQFWMLEVVDSPGYAGVMREKVPVNSENVDFRLEGAGELSGRVYDTVTNRPVTSFEIRILHGKWSTYNAADGSFTFAGVTPGSRLEVSAQGYETTTLGPLDAQVLETGLEVGLVPAEGLEGVVVDAATGEPLPGARVTVLRPELVLSKLAEGFGWSAQDPVTDESGRFVLDVSARGPVNVLAWKEAYALTVTAETQDTELVVPLGPGGAVEGVVDRSGAPAANLHVSAERHGGQDEMWLSMNTTTSTRGKFSFRLLPPGLYAIRLHDTVALDATLLGETHIEISHGQVVPLQIHLK